MSALHPLLQFFDVLSCLQGEARSCELTACSAMPALRRSSTITSQANEVWAATRPVKPPLGVAVFNAARRPTARTTAVHPAPKTSGRPSVDALSIYAALKSGDTPR